MSSVAAIPDLLNWRNSFHRNTTNGEPVEIAVCMRDAAETRWVVSEFFRHGCHVCKSEKDELYAKLLQISDSCGVLIVEVESWKSVDSALTSLFDFRKKFPRVSIILLSSDFGRDDLSLNRLAFCDISLKYPCSVDRLVEHIPTALCNNKFWQARVRTN